MEMNLQFILPNAIKYCSCLCKLMFWNNLKTFSNVLYHSFRKVNSYKYYCFYTSTPLSIVHSLCALQLLHIWITLYHIHRVGDFGAVDELAVHINLDLIPFSTDPQRFIGYFTKMHLSYSTINTSNTFTHSQLFHLIFIFELDLIVFPTIMWSSMNSSHNNLHSLMQPY